MNYLFRLVVAALLASTALLPGKAWAATHVAPAAFTLNGRISSHTGAPVPGAIVAVKGKAALATTNSAGSFLLAVEEAKPVLVVTCQGYQPQTLAVLAQGNLTITLYPIGVAPPPDAALGDATTAPVANPYLVVADVQPTYPGGATAYREYLRQNARYPEEARAAGIEGAVFVSFLIDETGRILDAQVVKGCGHGLDEEALRLVRLMPWWSPGQVAGKPVKVPCTLRIKFGVAQQ